MLFSYFVYIAPFTEFAREAFFQENICSWKNQKRKKAVGEKKKKEEKKKQLKEERKGTNLSRKEKKLPLWKWLVLAELQAGVQILNKEVAVKPKFTIHNVKNELSLSLCKYQPWYKNICILNSCLESQFWKLYVDSYSCSTAHFAFFYIVAAGFFFAFGNFISRCCETIRKKK